MLFGKIGPWELLLILGVVLLFFGPKRIVGSITRLGKRIANSGGEKPDESDGPRRLD